VYDNEHTRPPGTDTPAPDYYHHRITELGISEAEARRYGILPDNETGDVLLAAYHFNGEPVTYVPANRRRALKNLQRRKTAGEVHEAHYLEKYYRRRFTPERAKAEGHKYSSPSKYETGENFRFPAFPMPAARAAYQQQITGGTVAFIEGELKAAALELHGIETVGFGGISLYRLDSATKDYITSRRPDTILVAYDADAHEVRREEGTITSKRAEDFYHSAARFSKQLFDHLADIGHRAKVIWCSVNPEAGPKGADDLLLSLNSHEAATAAAQLAAGKDGDFWKCHRLHPTTYKAKLAELFALDSPTAFYKRHQDKIGSDAFTWLRIEYKMALGTLVMLSDPFAINVDVYPLHIKKYLGDERPALDGLLARKKRLAISSETGTGKTTFLIDWAKRTDARLVLAVPTRNLCRQLARKHTLFAVYGSNDLSRAADAAAAQIVVATYDTVGHIPDLHRRTLVIDEAHNLVNHYGRVRGAKKLFRAVTLTRLQKVAENAAQVVYLSGTMPKALLKANEVPLVDVQLATPQPVHLHRVTARNSKKDAITEALLAALVAILPQSEGQTHFVLFNNKEQLDIIRRELVNGGYLSRDEIQVITRTHYEAGETDGFTDLIEAEQIREGVRLVLCTTIIAEGVNIENTNVGRVYVAGHKCPDETRQFAARFRELDAVDLYLILPPDKAPGNKFSEDAAGEIKYLTATAELAAERATVLSRAGSLEDYDRSEMFPNIRPNDTGDGFTVDTLAILAAVRDRMLATAPPAYLVGRLLAYPGFALAGTEVNTLGDDEKGRLDATRAAVKDEKDATLANLREKLKDAPLVAVAGLYHRYRTKGNRHGKAKLESLAGKQIDTVPHVDALAWIEDNTDALELKEGRELIRRAAQIIFLGIPDAAPWYKLSPQAWGKKWKEAITAAGLKVLSNRNDARKLPAGLHLDLKAKEAIAATVAAWIAENGETITDAQLAELVKDAIGRDARKGVHRAPCITRITKGRAAQLAGELFLIGSHRHGTRQVLTIGHRHGEIQTKDDFVCICEALKANPLKIRQLKE
jgi:hypothetical protein